MTKEDCGPPQTQRPVEIRRAIAQKFLAALEADLEANVAHVIAEVREERALDYLKLAINLLPGQIAVDAPNLKDVPNERLAELIREVRDVLAARAAAAGGDGHEREDAGPA